MAFSVGKLLWGFIFCFGQMAQDRWRHFNVIFIQNCQALRKCRWVSHRGARSHCGHIIARHIRNNQCYDFCRISSSSQSATFDFRQVLTHAVHFINWRTRFKKCAIDAAFFFGAHTINSQAQQCRAASRNESDDEIMFG